MLAIDSSNNYYYFYVGAMQHTYEFKKEDGQIVKEDVSVDVKDNFVQYHLNDDDSEVWVHDDFNRVSELTDWTQRTVRQTK